MFLRSKDKQTLHDIFSAANIDAEVWAYGSRVNGTAHEGSDLDLVIRSKELTPLPRKIFNSLREKITDSNIPVLVELRDWALLPESFHKNILQQHEVLFDSNKFFAEKNILNEPYADYKSFNKDADEN